MNRVFIPGGKGSLSGTRSFADFEIGDTLTLYEAAMAFVDRHPYHANLSIGDGIGVDGIGAESERHREAAANMYSQSRRLFNEFIRAADSGVLVPIDPPNWYDDQPADPSRRRYKTVDLLKVALEIGADSDTIRLLKQQYAPSIGAGATDTHDESAILTAPAVSGKKTARRPRRDGKRSEIAQAIAALESSVAWQMARDGQRCQMVEKHLGKSKGWCNQRTLGRAVADREKSSSA